MSDKPILYDFLFSGNCYKVRLLLSQRANPNQTDNLAGNSAIDYARQDPRAAAILRELEQRR